MKKRIIKKYQNRRLYDSKTSRTITLKDIAEFITNGEEIKIIDSKTEKDITNITLSQVIVELEKSKKSEKQAVDILKKVIDGSSAAVTDLARKAISESISVFSISKDKVKEVVNKMVKEGKVAREQGTKVTNDIWSAVKTSRNTFTKKLKELMEDKKNKYIKRDELLKIEKKINSIERKLGEVLKRSRKKKKK